MLCCWLQQLQEFGGPEVEKPDLLKGSIGSLKNLGLVSTTNTTSAATTTTTTTAAAPVTSSQVKTNVSTASGSIIKPNPCLDKRARYNVCIYSKHELFFHWRCRFSSFLFFFFQFHRSFSLLDLAVNIINVSSEIFAFWQCRCQHTKKERKIMIFFLLFFSFFF